MKEYVTNFEAIKTRTNDKVNITIIYRAYNCISLILIEDDEGIVIDMAHPGKVFINLKDINDNEVIFNIPYAMTNDNKQLCEYFSMGKDDFIKFMDEQIEMFREEDCHEEN